MKMPTALWHAFVTGLVAWLFVGSSANAAGTATLLSTDTDVRITGESGKSSEIRTVRFNIQGTPVPALRMVPTELLLTLPDQSTRRIDSGQVSIVPVAGLRAIRDFESYEISVTALPEYSGTYRGAIEAQVEGKPIAKIALTLTVVPLRTLTLDPEPKTASVPVINGGITRVLPGWLSQFAGPLERTSEFIAERSLETERQVRVPALPEGASIAAVRTTTLTLTQGGAQGNAPEFTIDKGTARDEVVLTVKAQNAAPGKYSAVGQFLITGTDRWISLPIDVLVRTNPVHVLLLVLLGVGLGRLAKFMTDRGNLAIETRQRYDALLARWVALEERDRKIFDEVLRALQPLLDKWLKYPALATQLTVAETRMQLFERAIRLREWATAKHRDEEARKLQALLEGIVKVQMPDSLSLKLDAIEGSLLSDPPQPQNDSSKGGHDLAPDVRLRHAGARQGRAFVIGLEIFRGLLWVLGLFLLGFVGFETLYVNGSTTFGANPFTDYLSAFIWGLSADVAARTISSLGRTAPR